MSLITCPDCGQKVSENAPTCVKCGSPIATHTIQATSKKWKGMQLAGGLLIIFGFASVCSTVGDAQAGSDPSGPVGAGLMLIGGMTLAIVGKFGAWWHHA